MLYSGMDERSDVQAITTINAYWQIFVDAIDRQLFEKTNKGMLLFQTHLWAKTGRVVMTYNEGTPEEVSFNGVFILDNPTTGGSYTPDTGYILMKLPVPVNKSKETIAAALRDNLPEIRSIFFHEMAHLLDHATKGIGFFIDNVYSDPEIQKKLGDQFLKEYFNNRSEREAFLKQLGALIWGAWEQDKLIYYLGKFSVFKRWLESSDITLYKVIAHLTDDNKKRFLKRLYQFFSDIKDAYYNSIEFSTLKNRLFADDEETLKKKEQKNKAAQLRKKYKGKKSSITKPSILLKQLRELLELNERKDYSRMHTLKDAWNRVAKAFKENKIEELVPGKLWSVPSSFFAGIHIGWFPDIYFRLRPAEIDPSRRAPRKVYGGYTTGTSYKQTEIHLYIPVPIDMENQGEWLSPRGSALREIFFHELTHVVDMIRVRSMSKIFGDSYDKAVTNRRSETPTIQDHRAYYNNPGEVNAYFMQIGHAIFSALEMEFEMDRAYYKKQLNSFTTFKKYVEANSMYFRSWYDQLTDSNKKRVQKRLYDLYVNTKDYFNV